MNFLNSLFPDPQSSFPLLAVILAFPAIGAIVNGLFGKRLGPSGVKTMALASVFGSFFAALLAFATLYVVSLQHEGAHVKLVWNAWRWVNLETTGIDVAFSIDALSATMMLVVTGVGGLIHLYATSYMKGDPSYHRFFAYLNLFIFSMLVLVLGDSLPILFVGWEGVGLCSYLLIGFWFEDGKNAAAGKKAFIANRIGDFGLLVAMAMILNSTGALSWTGIEAHASELLAPIQVWPIGHLGQFIKTTPTQVSGATIVGLALFLGCAGKSAQIPLYVWLPDAMAGPTPVSALIHAATMVTAGVYLVARLNYVFLLSPTTMMVVAGVGAATALFAATIGVVQNDIKKVLAYSTVSQLGFMFIGVGVGAFSAGFFHVFTHAFFKACLFLCAGSVIHSLHARIHDTDASQDMRNMGGLRKYMPTTFYTYLISTFAITGFPLMSGFFSKDEILYRAFVNRIQASEHLKELAIRMASVKAGSPLSEEAKQAVLRGLEAPSWFGPLLFAVGVTAAVLTAFYMFRSVFLTFFGDFRGWRIVPGWKEKEHGHDDHAHAHKHEEPGSMDGPIPQESPSAMTLPLIVLATFAAFAGILNAGPFHFTPMEHWLEPVFESSSHLITTIKTGEELKHLEHMLLIPGVLAFFVGAGLAYFIYQVKKGEPARQLVALVPGLHRLVYEKWRIDELYDATIFAAFESLAEVSVVFDKYVIDGIIARATAGIVAITGSLLRVFQTGKIQVYALTMVLGLIAVTAQVVFAHGRVRVSQDEKTGDYAVEATPGLGYRYRWDLDNDGKWDSGEAWTNQRTAPLAHDQQPAAGQTKIIRLQVQNAFKMTSTKEVTLSRPQLDLSGAPSPIGLNAGGAADRGVAQ